MRKITALLVIVGVATIIMSGLFVYAAYTVWSNEVIVEVGEGYINTLNSPTGGGVGVPLTLTGTLTYNGGPVSGVTVTLYVNDSVTSSTGVTTSTGTYSVQWTPTTAGTYSFETLATVS